MFKTIFAVIGVISLFIVLAFASLVGYTAYKISEHCPEPVTDACAQEAIE